jgi:membrane-bound lytic murein transglycosylase A
MTAEAKLWRSIALISLAVLVVLSFVLIQPTFTGRTKPPVELPPFGYEITSYAELEGWAEDDVAAALPAFLLSCDAVLKKDPAAVMNSREALGVDTLTSLSGNVADWQAVCEEADVLLESAPTTQEVRAYFENNFTPVKILQPSEEQEKLTEDGLFTGYFEPAYPAALAQSDTFPVPVLTRPQDLVMVELGDFREELAGQRIAGRVKGGRLAPYEDHAAIIENGLDTDVLAWMNPNDLLFLQIQGSGKLLFDNGETLRVGYAAQNGHPYTAIGGPLIRRGEVAREDMSMQAIYDWLENATPGAAAELRHLNASYVFFRELDNLPDPALGPLGAQGLQLTDMRSLAVDRRYHAMGAPVFIALEGDEETAPLQQLMIAQDTGGAIRGPVRGDVYIGSGKEAGEIAGKFNRQGKLYVLLPNALAARLLQ